MWYSAIGSRKTQTLPSAFAGDARAEHRGRVDLGTGGRRDHEPRDVAQDAERVVVVEVTPEALLVAVALDPHHHPVAVRASREELQRRRLAAQLVLGVVEVREVLDLGDRDEARDGGPEREPEDRRLVEQRVEDPPRPKRDCSPRVMP